MPGEAAAEVARRARVALRAMGLPVPQTPMRSQGKHPKCQATKLASTMGTCKDTMEQAAHQTSASGGAPSSKPPAIGGERLAPNCLAAGMFASFSHQLSLSDTMAEQVTHIGFQFRRNGKRKRTDARKRINVRKQRGRTDVRKRRRTCRMCTSWAIRGWAQGFCRPHARDVGLEDPRKSHYSKKLKKAKVARESDFEAESQSANDGGGEETLHRC